MIGRRRYDEGCAVAHALDLVGERWALLIVRELLLGPKRFTDLRAGLPGASPDVLSQRLRELKDAGVVRQHKLPPPAGSWVYGLTEWGSELEPIVVQLGRWGSRSPALPHDVESSVDSFALSLRALFDPSSAAGFTTAIVLRLGADRFSARITDGRFELTRGEVDAPDAIVDTHPHTLSALLHDGRSLADTLRAGDITIDGRRDAVARFLGLFPLPESAATP
jgi:DNA-binding HxlR family transcriptional regulator